MIDLIVSVVMVYPQQCEIIIIFIKNVVAECFFEMLFRRNIKDKYPAVLKKTGNRTEHFRKIFFIRDMAYRIHRRYEASA